MAQKNIKNLVKNKEWQEVRRSLLGKWKSDPEWCCGQLRKFLGSVSTTSNDNLRIILNYTTGSVFRAKVITHPCVAQIRIQISTEIKKRKAMGKWD
jgi:hypothetical protein